MLLMFDNRCWSKKAFLLLFWLILCVWKICISISFNICHKNLTKTIHRAFITHFPVCRHLLKKCYLLRILLTSLAFHWKSWFTKRDVIINVIWVTHTYPCYCLAALVSPFLLLLLHSFAAKLSVPSHCYFLSLINQHSYCLFCSQKYSKHG